MLTVKLRPQLAEGERGQELHGSAATAGVVSIRHRSQRDICATLASVSARLRSTSVTTEQGRASAVHLTGAIGAASRMSPAHAT